MDPGRGSTDGIIRDIITLMTEMSEPMNETKKRLGVCPVKSEEILRFALNGLAERGAMEGLPEERYFTEAKKLGERLPEYYLPDVYLDIPLMGGAFEGMAAVMDCYDRCWIDYRSEGRFFRDQDLPSFTEPENRDTLLILRSGGDYTATDKNSLSPAKEADFPAGLNELPASFMKEPCPEGYRLVFTTGSPNPKKRFTQRPCREKIRQILREAGCGEEALDRLDMAAYNCGVPFLHPHEGYMEWVVCLDVAAIRLTVKDGRVTDCHAVIRISDRSVSYSKLCIKPCQAYQWHITDNCDQRCKHCYLFAEDARLKCISTPWEQLIHTLDEIEADAAARYAVAMPVISGGDPILHPQFWEFAREIHRRGLRWSILGNPFHLNDEVCRKLYELGCFKYQLSMDGLQEFHDYMRKPGSFQATLDAVKYLNGAGIMSQFMATASRQNLDDIIACMDIAVEHNVGFFTFARYCATSPDKAGESYPTPEEYRDFLLRYYNKRKAYIENNCQTRFQLKEHLFTLLQYELGDFVIPEYAKEHPELVCDGCHLGMSCCILPNGDLMACRRMESLIGNVKDDSIRGILTSEECKRYADVQNIKKCRDCELLNFCRGCRAVGFNATGDLQCADPMCWK